MKFHCVTVKWQQRVKPSAGRRAAYVERKELSAAKRGETIYGFGDESAVKTVNLSQIPHFLVTIPQIRQARWQNGPYKDMEGISTHPITIDFAGPLGWEVVNWVKC
jgi:hypothetical protein